MYLRSLHLQGKPTHWMILTRTDNRITDKGVEIFIQILEYNYTLKTVEVADILGGMT